VRSRAKGDEGVLPFADFLARVKSEIAARALPVKAEKKPV
jgi:threonyl-tRNA synthetase